MKFLITLALLLVSFSVFSETVNGLRVKDLDGKYTGSEMPQGELSKEEYEKVMKKLEKFKKHREDSLKYLEQLDNEEL